MRSPDAPKRCLSTFEIEAEGNGDDIVDAGRRMVRPKVTRILTAALLADATKRGVGAALGERREVGSRSGSVGESVGFGGRIAKEQGEFFVRRIFLLDGDNRSVGVGGDRSDEGSV